MFNNMYNAYQNGFSPSPIIGQQKPTHQVFNMTTVSGIEGARSYPLANNVTMPLWDQNEHKIYIKSTDNDGVATYQIVTYTIEDTENDSKYITKDEFTKYLDNYMGKLKEMILNGESTVSKSEQAVQHNDTAATDVPVFQ